MDTPRHGQTHPNSSQVPQKPTDRHQHKPTEDKAACWETWRCLGPPVTPAPNGNSQTEHRARGAAATPRTKHLGQNRFPLPASGAATTYVT